MVQCRKDEQFPLNIVVYVVIQHDGKDTSGNHEEAMFGPSGVQSISSVSESKTTSPPVLSPEAEKESLFASWVSWNPISVWFLGVIVPVYKCLFLLI